VSVLRKWRAKELAMLIVEIKPREKSINIISYDKKTYVKNNMKERNRQQKTTDIIILTNL